VLAGHACRGLRGPAFSGVINAKSEKAGIGDEKAKRTTFLVSTPFRRAIDDLSLFNELSLAQGLDDLGERGSFDAQILREGKKGFVGALRRGAQNHKLAVAELGYVGWVLDMTTSIVVRRPDAGASTARNPAKRPGEGR
jgi:hypothetical protein